MDDPYASFVHVLGQGLMRQYIMEAVHPFQAVHTTWLSMVLMTFS
jgi:hypothetical protein